MQEDNIIKSITTHSCPHCGGEIFIESLMTPPSVNSVFTTKEVEEAKADCLHRVETLAIEEERKNSVIKWLEDPNTIFGPNEVENIILSLLKPTE
jgi:hypothetical protein